MSDQPDRESRDRDVDLSAIGDTFKQLMGHMKVIIRLLYFQLAIQHVDVSGVCGP